MTAAGLERSGPDRATLLAFLGVVLFGGINAVAVKQMVLELPPLWSAGRASPWPGLVLVVLAVATRRSLPTQRASIVGALAYGTFGFATSFGLRLSGPPRGPTGYGDGAHRDDAAVHLRPRHGPAPGTFPRAGPAGYVDAAAGDRRSSSPTSSARLCRCCRWRSSWWARRPSPNRACIVKWTPEDRPLLDQCGRHARGRARCWPWPCWPASRFVAPGTMPGSALGHLVVLGSVAMFSLYVFGIGRWTASGCRTRRC